MSYLLKAKRLLINKVISAGQGEKILWQRFARGTHNAARVLVLTSKSEMSCSRFGRLDAHSQLLDKSRLIKSYLTLIYLPTSPMLVPIPVAKSQPLVARKVPAWPTVISRKSAVPRWL
jgi:hypothetical protein